MKNMTAVLLLLTVSLAATSARAMLPEWGPDTSVDEIQAILKEIRHQRSTIPQKPTTLSAPEQVYKDVFASVDASHISEALLKDMSGVNPVSVGGETFSITDRYSPASKANYRKYWINYFKSLGIPATEMTYANSHGNGESDGHNVEAMLPGASPDSVVIIVHYDSIGPNGADNPGGRRRHERDGDSDGDGAHPGGA
jgi:hypothetical protein